MKHLLQSYLADLRSGHLDYATDNYCFRQFVKADVHPLFAASRNPHFNKFLLWNQPSSIETTMVQVKKLLREDAINQSSTFSIVEKVTGKWVGFVRWIPYQNGLAGTLWLHPDYWGSGAVNELNDALFAIVFLVAQVSSLYIFIQPANTPMVRIAQKKGMEELNMIELVHEDGAPRTFQVYHVARGSWENRSELSTF